MNRFPPRNRRNASSETLSRLWAEFPAERETLRPYVDRAKSYRNECGCAMGANSLSRRSRCSSCTDSRTTGSASSTGCSMRQKR